MAGNDDFWVRFWGVRGTVPCPGPLTLRYGGNTSCIEVCCGGERLIFDAGTGLRMLGATLAEQSGLAGHIFLTHTHIDHINGFPFFRPAYDPDNRFKLWAGHMGGQSGSLKAVLSDMMRTPIFPVPLRIMHACIAFNDFTAGEDLEPVPGIVLRTAPLNHPGGATGYRIEYGGRSICYVTDTEHGEGGPDEAVIKLIEDSQIVIYDAMYTEEEYPRFRGWGHSTWVQGARLCDAAGARQLIAFHHDPDHSDEDLDRIGNALGKARPGSRVAREGLVLHA
jgi:phosphoribosyl 1,2-cyclic phosphodiesterase